MAGVALTLALLVGCSGPGSSSSSSGGGSGSGAAVAPGGAAGTPDSDADRQVVTTATASVTVKDPAAGAQRVSGLVEAAGGRVDERTEQTASGSNGTAGADLVVRIPADALTDLLADLEKVGDVANVSVSRSDVTAKTVDLDARIAALQTSVARLEGLMSGAASTADLLTAEKALSERQSDLESLQSQRALLADQVELSTLTVHLAPFGVAPPGGPDGFLDALGTGWRALVSVLHGALIVLGILVPWLVVAGFVATAVLVPIRMIRRRGAAPAPASAGSGPAPPQG